MRRAGFTAVVLRRTSAPPTASAGQRPSTGLMTQVGAPEMKALTGSTASRYGAAIALITPPKSATKTPSHGFGRSDAPFTIAGVAANARRPVPAATETA